MLTTEFNMDLALEVKAEEATKRTSREIAKKMLGDGMSIETIIKYTGLTVDDVIELQREA